jgi:acyl-CoA synthetase (AMP-forming)/AMP-acid ligase II
MGYWNLIELTAEDFHAHLAPDKVVESTNVCDADYLRTGDLGFLHEGELFICGRSKDLLIVRGTNHFPQDIEKTAENRVPELRPGCSAAFALPNDGYGTERVVFVAEVFKESYRRALILSYIVCTFA